MGWGYQLADEAGAELEISANEVAAARASAWAEMEKSLQAGWHWIKSGKKTTLKYINYVKFILEESKIVKSHSWLGSLSSKLTCVIPRKKLRVVKSHNSSHYFKTKLSCFTRSFPIQIIKRLGLNFTDCMQQLARVTSHNADQFLSKTHWSVLFQATFPLQIT